MVEILRLDPEPWVFEKPELNKNWTSSLKTLLNCCVDEPIGEIPNRGCSQHFFVIAIPCVLDQLILVKCLLGNLLINLLQFDCCFKSPSVIFLKKQT